MARYAPFTFAHWQNMLADPVFFLSLKNCLFIATLTALAGIVLYSLAAYLIVSKRSRSGQLIDLLSWLPWVVPGILMSLGLLWIFLATPLRIFLYGSIWGIALAMIIKDSPVTTQAFKAAFLQLRSEEHTSELQSLRHLVCRLLLEKKNNMRYPP